jgi:transcriptional regulator with XRE-family HTH domain
LRAIAKALKYSAPYVLDLETGKRSWSPSTQPKLQKTYLTAIGRVKTAQALIKKRKAARVSVEQLAAQMNVSTTELIALEAGQLPWKFKEIDYKKLYISALKSLVPAQISAPPPVIDNSRDLKIKQLIMCLDGCSDEELNEIVNLAEAKYLRRITDAEEREFYRKTLEKIYKNNLPLSRDFIYS